MVAWEKMKLTKKQVISVIYALLIIGGLIALDQFGKLAVAKNLELGASRRVLGNFFRLEYVQNTGAAWGMFAGRLVFFIIIGLVATGVFGFLLKDFDLKEKLLYSIAVCLMFAGTVGNLIDRIAYNYVIDYFSFNFGTYSFPVFNLADVMLTLGVAAFIVEMIMTALAKR